MSEVEDAMAARCAERLQHDACKELFKEPTRYGEPHPTWQGVHLTHEVSPKETP